MDLRDEYLTKLKRSGPGGPVSAKTEPSPLAMYQALNDDRKTQFHEYFNAEFQIATDNNPEQWQLNFRTRLVRMSNGEREI
jgi:hypothetical protein